MQRRDPRYHDAHTLLLGRAWLAFGLFIAYVELNIAANGSHADCAAWRRGGGNQFSSSRMEIQRVLGRARNRFLNAAAIKSSTLKGDAGNCAIAAKTRLKGAKTREAAYPMGYFKRRADYYRGVLSP